MRDNLTKEQAVILSAYTGVLMCNFGDFHEYVEKIMDRPVFTHEMADREISEQIKEASKSDFLSICAK